MRRILDGIYRASGWLAALSLLAILLVICAQIVGRLVGVVVPSVTQMAGFFLATTIFLGLAFTLAAGEHVRVTLVLDRFGPRVRFWMEAWVLAASAAVSAFMCFYIIQLAYESWLFGDRADGLLPIPLVLPQGFMALGAIVLLIRLVDELIMLFQTGRPLHEHSGEEAALHDLLAPEPPREP